MNKVILLCLLFILSCSTNHDNHRAPASSFDNYKKSCSTLIGYFLKPRHLAASKEFFSEIDFHTFIASAQERALYMTHSGSGKGSFNLQLYENHKKMRMRRGQFSILDVEDNLELEEISAIIGYQGSSHLDINSALRTGDHEKLTKWKSDILVLTSALNKLPDHIGTVYRHANLPKSKFKALKEGDFIIEEGFTSTSTMRNYTENRANISDEEYSVLYQIQSRSGKDITNSEAEVLFRPFTQFQIQSIHKEGKTYIVVMDEL